MSVSGNDGEDMYWRGAFLAGQSGLCFEKIKNGGTLLRAFSEGAAQNGSYAFASGPLYDAENRIEIRQGARFSDEIFNQKWVDSLSSSQRLEFAKDWKDAGNDHGKELVFQSAKYPMRLEMQFDGRTHRLQLQRRGSVQQSSNIRRLVSQRRLVYARPHFRLGL
jgi:hypothetical protein